MNAQPTFDSPAWGFYLALLGTQADARARKSVRLRRFAKMLEPLIAHAAETARMDDEDAPRAAHLAARRAAGVWTRADQQECLWLRDRAQERIDRGTLHQNWHLALTQQHGIFAGQASVLSPEQQTALAAQMHDTGLREHIRRSNFKRKRYANSPPGGRRG